jgi:hypothetical protein
MRRLLLSLPRRLGRAARARSAALPLLGLTLLGLGCATPSLMSGAQAASVKERERALARHADAIHRTIQASGNTGALAFLDAVDGRLVVLPGDGPAEAWARFGASPDAESGRVAPPEVMTFVHRADVPEPPETVSKRALRQHEEARASAAALERQLGDLRDTHRRMEERLAAVQRELTEAIAASRQETDASLAASRAEVQQALNTFNEDLAAVRQFLLQTAQLGWLNHEMNVENAGGIRKVTTASQELSASAARLQEAVRQLSDGLNQQLKELATRLETIQTRIGSLK